jgi:hypothetical protein
MPILVNKIFKSIGFFIIFAKRGLTLKKQGAKNQNHNLIIVVFFIYIC